MNKAKILALILLLSFVIPISVSAYSYPGYKWFQWPYNYVNVDIDPTGRNAAENLAITSAMMTWRNAKAKFLYLDTTTKSNHDFRYYNDSGSSILARTYISLSIWGYINNMYIEVNAAKPWATNGSSSAYDFQNMAVHELGHGLQLGDISNNSEATMYYSMAKGETKKRTLDVDDVNGIKSIYGSL